MFCFKVRKHLIPYIEKTLSEPKMNSIAEHLKKCSGCTQELSVLQRASSAFKGSKIAAQEPMEDIWAKIEQQISVSAPEPVVYRYPVRTLKLAGVAVAMAAIILACGIFYNPNHKQRMQIATTEQTKIEQKDVVIAEGPRTSVLNSGYGQPKIEPPVAPEPKVPSNEREVFVDKFKPPVFNCIEAQPARSTNTGDPDIKTPDEVPTEPYVMAINNRNVVEPELSPDIKMESNLAGNSTDNDEGTPLMMTGEPDRMLAGAPPGPAGPVGSPSRGMYPSLNQNYVYGYGSVYPSTVGGQREQSTAVVLANRRPSQSQMANLIPITSIDMLNLIDEDARNSAVFCY